MVWFKCENGQTGKARLISVSIPLWYDSNLTNQTLIVQQGFVSIPLWYDSNGKKKFTINPNIFCLNSTMVWFKLSNQVAFSTSPYKSQFHYGMIQMLRFFNMVGKTSLVSIPLWYDSNNYIDAMVLRDIFVSIPLWYDSNWLLKNPFDKRKYCLNSTMVWFKWIKLKWWY